MSEREISRPYDGVTFRRGWGDTGRRILIVENTCKVCGHDRLLKEERISPEVPDSTEYHCRHPNCPAHKPANSIIPSPLR